MSLYFRQIQRRETSIAVKMQAALATRLTIGQAGKLLGIAKQELDLETGFVVAINGFGILVDVCAEQQGIASFLPVTEIENIDQANITL